MPPWVRVIQPADTHLAVVKTLRRNANAAPYRGVVATARIPANTFVAVYPGRVYRRADWERLVLANRLSAKYGVDMFSISADGTVRTGQLVVDPTDATNAVAANFARALGPFVNEPSPGNRRNGNLRWVYNLPARRMEYWTSTDVAKGEELLICYGDGYGPERDYATACGGDARFWYILRPGGAPGPLAVEVRSTDAKRKRSTLTPTNRAARAALKALAKAPVVNAPPRASSLDRLANAAALNAGRKRLRNAANTLNDAFLAKRVREFADAQNARRAMASEAAALRNRRRAATTIQAGLRGMRDRALARRLALLAFHDGRGRRGRRGVPVEVILDEGGEDVDFGLTLPDYRVRGADLKWLVQAVVRRDLGQTTPRPMTFEFISGANDSYVRPVAVNSKKTVAEQGPRRKLVLVQFRGPNA